MKRLSINPRMKKLILLAVFFSMIFLFVSTPLMIQSAGIIYSSVIYPAYLSTSVDCHPVSYEQGVKDIEQKGYQVGGYFNYQTEEIVVYTPDIRAIKHEICHAQQKEQNRTYLCSNKIMVFVNEAECYLRQYYMDSVNFSRYGFQVDQ